MEIRTQKIINEIIKKGQKQAKENNYDEEDIHDFLLGEFGSMFDTIKEEIVTASYHDRIIKLCEEDSEREEYVAKWLVKNVDCVIKCQYIGSIQCKNKNTVIDKTLLFIDLKSYDFDAQIMDIETFFNYEKRGEGVNIPKAQIKQLLEDIRNI